VRAASIAIAALTSTFFGFASAQRAGAAKRALVDHRDRPSGVATLRGDVPRGRA
jgi:hypothetical protein